MELKKGMVFVNEFSDRVTIVDPERYSGPQGKVFHHGPNLKADLAKWGWKLDENSIIDKLLEKYGE